VLSRQFVGEARKQAVAWITSLVSLGILPK
jgi:hypothetical protein